MGGRSKIEWTDATWNPVSGCTPVGEGCRNCYAERMVSRLPVTHLRGNLRIPGNGHAFSQVILHEQDLLNPLRWRKPRRVFVCSMGDLFHENVPFEFVDRVWATMLLARRHTFMVLTKRPDRMKAYLCDHALLGQDVEPTWYDIAQQLLDEGDPGPLGTHWTACHQSAEASYVWEPLHNVWLGVSVESQAQADKRIPPLLQCPAVVRFVSCEPLLGHIDMPWLLSFCPSCNRQLLAMDRMNMPCGTCFSPTATIDLVIAGGESGPNARPSHPEWFRSLRDQCAAAGVPFFFKQWGEWAPNCLCGRKTPHGTIDRPSPGGRGVMFRCGKRNAGRSLDGVEHNGMLEDKQ